MILGDFFLDWTVNFAASPCYNIGERPPSYEQNLYFLENIQDWFGLINCISTSNKLFYAKILIHL